MTMHKIYNRLIIKYFLCAICLAAATAFILSFQAFAVESATSDERVVIHTSNGEHPMTIELADSSDELMKGLMFRESLDANAGMLFYFGYKDIITMWMKNTPLPLDMIFIDEKGVVKHIAENAVPYSLDTINSQLPVTAVLEVNAGTAKRLGIKTGDTIAHPLFKP